MDAAAGGLSAGAGDRMGDHEGGDCDVARSEYLFEHDAGVTAAGAGRGIAGVIRVASVFGMRAEVGLQTAQEAI